MSASPSENPEKSRDSLIRHATDNAVSWITLNRPEAMNAITPDQRERLIRLLADASADPAGLEKVAADKGIDAKVEDHAAADSPLADYGVEGLTDTRLSGGLAGVIGVGVTVVAGTGIFWAVRKRRTGEDDATSPTSLPENA